MLYIFRNEDDGCRSDSMFLQFLSHPQVYLRIETAAKVRQFAAEENEEFIKFVYVGNRFPANRIGKHLPAYISCSSRQGRGSSEICLRAGNLRERWQAVERSIIICLRFRSVIT